MSSPDLILVHAPSVYDFRREPILFGPVSDLVPSTPVFEMYPIGFTTMAEYLERHGFRVRIVNLAHRMLQDPDFDVEKSIASMQAALIGIDLHWLPHAHGALEVAAIVRRKHPNTPIVFGGISASYYHLELTARPEVDYVLRGDSTEAPLLELVRHLCSGGRVRPPVDSKDGGRLSSIPNLTWKDSDGQVHANPISHCPPDLDSLLLDYSYVPRAVLRYRDLAGFIPFPGWIRYPITAALSVRGCRYNCAVCGGSCYSYRHILARDKPAFRKPEDLANDIRKVSRFSGGPTFVLGDIRHAGGDYADRFLDAISGYRKPLFLELFDAAEETFMKRLAASLSDFAIQVSLESHEDAIRHAFGRPYSTETIERTIEAALEAGCQRLDVFFMIGLPHQTADSVMRTIDYCESLLQRFSSPGDRRLVPFISPLAPFLDPGSRAFDQPERLGYRLRCRSLEQHRRALLAPSWKYILNYETRWMDRDTIVRVTYQAASRLNRLKARYGVVGQASAEATEARIERALSLSAKVDEIMGLSAGEERQRRLADLRLELSQANLSTVCDKRELELPLRRHHLGWLPAASLVLDDWVKRARARLSTSAG